MKEPELNPTEIFKLDKRFKLFVAIYLSIIVLVIIFVLVKVEMLAELQQVIVIILGLTALATLDAFKKVVDDTASNSFASEFKQTIIKGGYYAEGNIYSDSRTQQSNTNQVAIPPNYFDVMRTIESVPDSPNADQPGAREALVKLQAYVETESELDLDEKVQALEQLKSIAIAVQRIDEPFTSEQTQTLGNVARVVAEIDRSPLLKTRLIKAFRAGGIEAIKSLPDFPVVNVLLAAVQAFQDAEMRKK